MDTELSEISTFIHNIPPFDSLPKQVLAQLVRELNINYVRKSESLPPTGINEPRLYILRKGAISCLSKDGELVSRLGEGDLCTAFYYAQNTDSLLELKSKQQVHTDEDSLVYSVDVSVLENIGERFPSISDFFNQNSAQRLKSKMNQINEESILSSTLMNTSVSNFYHSPVASIEASQSIQQAAIQMTEQSFSCLVVIENKEAQQVPIGIVTDKDIRRRCVAEGLSSHEAVSKIMTRNMCTIDIKSNAYDALMTMTAKHIHHLPVTKYGKLVGMVTVTDLINKRGS